MVLSLTIPGSWVIPTPFGYLLGSGLEVPTLPPLDLQHIPQADRDPPPVLAGLRWAPSQWLSTTRKFEHQERWRERARGLERGPRGSQVCQDMSRQPAAESRSYGRQLRRISLPLFPTPPSRSGWGGRGGDVRAPPRPRLPGADRVLRLQSASQPVAAKDAQAASSFPAAVISPWPQPSPRRNVRPSPPRGVLGLRRALASSHSPPEQPARAPRCARLLGFRNTGSSSVSHASDCR